jgi:hypothetical protein
MGSRGAAMKVFLSVIFLFTLALVVYGIVSIGPQSFETFFAIAALIFSGYTVYLSFFYDYSYMKRGYLEFVLDFLKGTYLVLLFYFVFKGARPHSVFTFFIIIILAFVVNEYKLETKEKERQREKEKQLRQDDVISDS